MFTAFCQSCQRVTGHKRALGWGTFFAVVLTFGFWLLAIPFYRKRCVICGLLASEQPASEEKVLSRPRSTRWTLVVLALLVVGIVFTWSRIPPPEPQPTERVRVKDDKAEAIPVCVAALGPLTVEATGGNLGAGELNVVARCRDGRRCLCWATRRGQTWTAEVLR